MKRKAKQKANHWKRWLLALVLAVLVAVGIVVAPVVQEGYTMYKQAVEQVPLEQKVEQLRDRPDYQTLDQLPQWYLKAVLAVEDHRFYYHPGIDPIALVRAVWNNIQSGSYEQGGSTITQQLAKNLYFTQEKLVSRKIAEVFLSIQLEYHYTKDEILEMYVNDIYFGEGYLGIGAACQGYYDIQPSQMTFDQATILAGVPNAPSAYAPSENMELARQRQRQVIDRMVDCHYLTWEQAEELLQDTEPCD